MPFFHSFRKHQDFKGSILLCSTPLHRQCIASQCVGVFLFRFFPTFSRNNRFSNKKPDQISRLDGFTLIHVAQGNGTKVRIILGLAKLHIRGSDVHDHFRFLPAGHMNNKVPRLNLVSHIGTVNDNIMPGLSLPEFRLDTGSPDQPIQDVI